MQVRVENLKRYYGRTRAVDGVSFGFQAGRIVGFVGPNGAGKTTTLRILATVDEPTGGDAFLDGISVVEDPEQARRLVGFMPDYLPAHGDTTVHEYLDFYARAHGIRDPRRSSVVENVKEFASLGPVREKTLRSLSKGMKQRVSLARALVHDPPVLLLDEPAAGLDPRARVELRELLRLLAEQGKAILISSHILTELSEICNDAVIIEQGKIIRAGPIDNLLSGNVQRHLVRVRSLGSLQDLLRAVLQMPAVEDGRIDGRYVEVVVGGNEQACQTLLAELVRQGLPVVEFTHQKTDLEDVFMNLTKGNVQ